MVREPVAEVGETVNRDAVDDCRAVAESVRGIVDVGRPDGYLLAQFHQ